MRILLVAMTIAANVAIVAVPTARAQVCAPTWPCGDVNASDQVTVADALAVLRRSLGLDVQLTCSCTGGDELLTGALVETGQTMCWNVLDTVTPIDPIDCAGTGQDGEYQKGLSSMLVDNGDGTISDLRTTLVWEKLTNDNSVHDYDNFSYLWEGAFQRVSVLNAEAFAGYTDWRVPNVRELQSLIDFSRNTPAVATVLHRDCAAGCTSASCSCTYSGDYWSSDTYQQSPQNAWNIDFKTGETSPTGSKTAYKYVRAVRGGY